ncbi:hypothetical protein TNCV_3796201 [Trichonephila clavipes]|nr:hypothetical protein TNCV_3796201 [Trichonephila clavipes]
MSQMWWSCVLTNMESHPIGLFLLRALEIFSVRETYGIGLRSRYKNFRCHGQNYHDPQEFFQKVYQRERERESFIRWSKPVPR